MVCRYEGGGENEENPGGFLLWQHHALRAADRVVLYESQFTEQLDEAERTLPTKLVRSQHEIDSITAVENFVLGFRLGVRMMAECMNENDGDTREVADSG